MVSVIHSKDFYVPRIFPTSKISKDFLLKGFPTFYSKENEYILPVNLWLNYLQNIRSASDISCCVRAIKRYWQFLEDTGCTWNAFPPTDYLKPTYRFRNDDLLKAAKKGEIAYSTASLYMLQVIKFYEWADHERFITFTEDTKPFNYQLVHIANTGMMSHNNPKFVVRSTDLRIRKPAKNEHQSLNPLSKEELGQFATCLTSYSEEFIIHQLLQLQSGLRVEEACTFPIASIEKPNPNSKRYEVEIGPSNRVHTKFSKTRKIEIPASLMQRMYFYSISERRFNRAKKSAQEHTFLLLNNRGAPLCSNNIQQYFRRLREDIKSRFKTSFNHRTHDLRASYGTYRLDSLLDDHQERSDLKKRLPVGDALALVMAWMGHKDDKTTWKYLKYLRKEKANQSAMVLLDQILEESLK